MDSEFIDGDIPKIVFKDSETKVVSGAICAGSKEQIRLSFIEEKLANDEFGNVQMIRECNTQIVMTPDVAKNIIQVLQDNLKSNNL